MGTNERYSCVVDSIQREMGIMKPKDKGKSSNGSGDTSTSSTIVVDVPTTHRIEMALPFRNQFHHHHKQRRVDKCRAAETQNAFCCTRGDDCGSSAS